MAGLPSYAPLICVMVLFAADLRAASKPSTGVSVLLPHTCSSHGDSRDLVIRHLPGEKLWLNEASFEEGDLRSRVKERLATRFEKVLWVAADERVPYGEVVALLAMLHHDNPDAYIAITTKKQMGPIDPVDPEFQKTQLDPKLGIYNLCIPTSTIRNPQKSRLR
jgi:biopolymer transport protein ExbD